MKASELTKEFRAEAVAKTKCPTCGAEPGKRCRNTKADDKGHHKHVTTHNRRINAFVIY